MDFIESVFEKLRRHPKRIVFPEGSEPRILQAAEKFVKLGLGTPILLGDKIEIVEAARKLDVSLEFVMVINPATASDLPQFCRNLEKLDRYRKMGIKRAEDIMIKPNYFAAMMIQYGHADALVGGASGYAGTLLRPLIQLVKPMPGVNTISSCQVVVLKDKPQFGENGVLFMADCGVVPTPSVEQLGRIAFRAGQFARQVLGVTPRVALLSFSTKGSAKTPETERVVAAAAVAQEMARSHDIDMDIDGELQADAAIIPELAKVKVPDSRVAGQANVLIFPDLNSGNIASKLVIQLTGAKAYGQVLLGLSRPAVDLPRAAAVDEIVALAAIAGLQAIEYRKLYPEASGLGGGASA